ncbi:MAG: response regulator, partial [Methylacidiphilales bacterium]|nr:response regulator [Candidatus Methylacidiphilales bacterium]
MPQVEPQFEPKSEPSFASGESSHPAAHPAPRLLVIDDDLVQRMIICRIGAQVGYVATGAATVGEALRCLGDGGQDCVVFHLSLAEHHGIEALKALAGALAGTPVVVINGSGETVPARRCGWGGWL